MVEAAATACGACDAATCENGRSSLVRPRGSQRATRHETLRDCPLESIVALQCLCISINIKGLGIVNIYLSCKVAVFAAHVRAHEGACVCWRGAAECSTWPAKRGWHRPTGGRGWRSCRSATSWARSEHTLRILSLRRHLTPIRKRPCGEVDPSFAPPDVYSPSYPTSPAALSKII